MKVRHFLREMLTSLDEALLQEPVASPVALPASAALSDTAVTRRQVSEPASEADASMTLMTPIDVHDDIYTLLQPTNRMIYSPRNIEASVLHPFLVGEKSVMLVCSQSRKIMPATLQAIHENYLVADTQTPLSFRKLDEIILVVFPVATHNHYVMQTSIRALYAFRLELEYHDPRSDERYGIRLAEPVRLHLASVHLAETLAQQQGNIVRHTVLPPSSASHKSTGRILDLYCPLGETAYTTPPLAKVPPLEGTLRDISLGGIGATMQDGDASETFIHRLILLTMCLPSLPYTLPKWANKTLTCQLLGAVRGVSQVASEYIVHVRFLQRLPQDMETLLRSLARATSR